MLFLFYDVTTVNMYIQVVEMALRRNVYAIKQTAYAL